MCVFPSFWKCGGRMGKIIHPVDQWCCDWYLAPTHTMEYLRKKQQQKPQNMKCQWKWRTDLKNEISYSVTYHAADRSEFSEWDQSVERCSEFMLCKWSWSQPTNNLLAHVWPLIFTITDCFATSGLMLRIIFSFLNEHICGR